MLKLSFIGGGGASLPIFIVPLANSFFTHLAFYIDQSQSLNIFMENANFAKLTSMHFYGWKKGLKTGMYYLRTKAATDAIKFTLDKTIETTKLKAVATDVVENTNGTEENDENCEIC